MTEVTETRLKSYLTRRSRDKLLKIYIIREEKLDIKDVCNESEKAKR